MKNFLKYIFVIVSLSQLLFSCESNFKQVQNINLYEFTPTGEAEDFNLKYTDSGRIKSILISPKMLDYSSVEYPYTEFPNGINVTLFDPKGKKTLVTANFATSFKGTNMIDLKGNVKISNEEGQLLETEQLYFDQNNEWFHTQKPFKLSGPKGNSNGEGIDFSKDFKIVNSQHIKAEIDNNE